MKIIPLLLTDFYKTVHAEQYSDNLSKLVSYYTPRMSRIKEDHLINFGLQYFCKHYLIDTFNQYFFSLPEEEVMQDYNRILSATLGKGSYDDGKIRKLHRLGYLPLELAEIPEGTRVPIKVPMIQIQNTHPEFAWVTNAIESLMSATLWHIQVSANVGYLYRQIVNKWYDLTCDGAVNRSKALGDFSYRGQHSNESAIASSAAFCLSFLNTATVPAIMWLEDFYKCNCEKEEVAYGAISTEHSVMCSNYAIDGDERTFVKRLLTEIYPHHSFSMVSDSYDYWNMVTNIVPSLHKEIMEHDGTLLVRGDSGDPIEILCGKEYPCFASFEEMKLHLETAYDINLNKPIIVYVLNEYYTVISSKSSTGFTYEVQPHSPTSSERGTVECLWNEFGGTYNSKGYKVLDSHIKAIYGDSITQQRAEQIYRRLAKKGFAANNVVLGVGSFSFMCLEENGMLQPYTRDTYGIAVKATYGELKDGTPIQIYKNPATDTGHFKKSQKGMCYVTKGNEGITCMDGFTSGSLPSTGNLLEPIFRNSKMLKGYSLSEIRNRLYEGEF